MSQASAASGPREEPAGMEAEAQLLTSLHEIPNISKCWLRPAHAEGLSLTVWSLCCCLTGLLAHIRAAKQSLQQCRHTCSCTALVLYVCTLLQCAQLLKRYAPAHLLLTPGINSHRANVGNRAPWCWPHAIAAWRLGLMQLRHGACRSSLVSATCPTTVRGSTCRQCTFPTALPEITS